MDTDLDTLAKNDLFDSLSDEELESFLGFGERIEVAPDERIVEEEQEGQGIYYIIEGTLRVLKTDPKLPSNEIHVTSLGPGDCFGEMSTFTSRTTSASVVSKSESVLLFFPKNKVYEYLETYPLPAQKFLINLFEKQSRNLRMTTESLVSLKAQDEVMDQEQIDKLLNKLK